MNLSLSALPERVPGGWGRGTWPGSKQGGLLERALLPDPQDEKGHLTRGVEVDEAFLMVEATVQEAQLDLGSGVTVQVKCFRWVNRDGANTVSRRVEWGSVF